MVIEGDERGGCGDRDTAADAGAGLDANAASIICATAALAA